MGTPGYPTASPAIPWESLKVQTAQRRNLSGAAQTAAPEAVAAHHDFPRVLAAQRSHGAPMTPKRVAWETHWRPMDAPRRTSGDRSPWASPPTKNGPWLRNWSEIKWTPGPLLWNLREIQTKKGPLLRNWWKSNEHTRPCYEIGGNDEIQQLEACLETGWNQTKTLPLSMKPVEIKRTGGNLVKIRYLVTKPVEIR